MQRARVVPHDLRRLRGLADRRLGHDPLPRRAHHDRRARSTRRPGSTAPTGGGRPGTSRCPASGPTMITLLILNIGTFMAVGLREGPAAVQPADLPDRRRHLHLPVPGRPRVQQLQLRRRDRPVRGDHRPDAGPVRERDLAPHGGDEPVVTTDPTACGPADAAGAPVGPRDDPRLPGLPGGQRGRPDRASCVVTLYPFVNIVAQSFSSEGYISAGQVNLVPRGFNLDTYQLVIDDPMFWTQLPQHRALHRGRHRHRDGADHLLRVRAVEAAPQGPRRARSASPCSPCSSTAA